MFENIDRAKTYSVKYEGRKTLFGSADVMPLWIADMDIATPASVQEAILKRAEHPIYGYTIYPKEYFDSIRNWYRDRYDYAIDEDFIVPECGVVASIARAIEAFTKEGDGVIVQTPVYPPFMTLVKNNNRKLLENKLIYSDGKYEIDFYNFEELAKKSKLFLLCSPHNPISKVWSKEELEKLAGICKKHNIVVVSDEIHSDLVYGKNFISFGRLNYDNVIILNAPSKSFNIAGLKTSYVIIENSKLRALYKNIQQKNGYESGNPFGITALIGAYEDGKEWLDDLRVHLKGNIKLINESLASNNIPIFPTRTEATYLMWLDCSKLYEKQDKITQFFYEKAKLGLSDGKSFGYGGNGFMRLNFGTSISVIRQAMKQLVDAYNVEFKK